LTKRELGELNTIRQGDTIEQMGMLPDGVIDLAFADPPFNIGYKYDVYDDRQSVEDYLEWSRLWIEQVYRILKPDGTFWLAIGDDFAAELKMLSQQIGFHPRNWVIWYYTFGVHCSQKFTRSHTHLFYFVKNKRRFTFNRDAIAVPSARQLVYNDARANPKGRVPDDTWILRPQDCSDGFQPDETTWYFPRVAGTFKEREGFHGCQMPEQLLGRIIRASSQPGELVFDPFSGSATTAAVAKKLQRRFLSFELSPEYVAHGLKRLDRITPGDRLEGGDEPLVSAPATPATGEKTRQRTPRASKKPPQQSLFE
jgi:DNA modification methylase